MTRLEALALAETSCLILRLALVAPVALKIAGSSSRMTATAACITAHATSAVDGHTLAAAMTTATTSSEVGGWRHFGLDGGGLVVIVNLFGIRTRELETSRCSLLLCKLSSFLSVSQS